MGPLEPDGRLWPWQEDAVRWCLGAIDRHGGAVLADGVGMGKTRVALEVVRRRGGSVVVIGPPVLEAQWAAEARAMGVALCFGSLGGGGWGRVVAAIAGASLVVVDEAHRSGQPGTARRRRLRAALRGRPVLLLSATPIRNAVAELGGLLGLWLSRTWLARWTGCVGWSVALGHEGALGWLQEQVMLVRGAELWRGVGVEVRVRRVDLPGTLIEPGWVEEVRGLARELAQGGAPVEVIVPGGAPGGRLTADGPGHLGRAGAEPLWVIGLLRAMVSSGWAAARMLERAARWVELTGGHDEGSVGDGADEGTGWSAAEARAIVRGSVEQLVFGFYHAGRPATLWPSGLAGRLRALARRVGGADDRWDALGSWLSGLKGPAVCFAEYGETARGAGRWLAAHCGVPVVVVTASGAWISGWGGRHATLDGVGVFADRVGRGQRNAVLVTTPVLSDGMNLQMADAVVHLDLPWNDARLQQRVGRVARPGGATEVLVATRAADGAAERVLRLGERVANKARMAVEVGGVGSPSHALGRLRLRVGAALLGARAVADGPRAVRVWRVGSGLDRAVVGVVGWGVVAGSASGPPEPACSAVLAAVDGRWVRLWGWARLCWAQWARRQLAERRWMGRRAAGRLEAAPLERRARWRAVVGRARCGLLGHRSRQRDMTGSTGVRSVAGDAWASSLVLVLLPGWFHVKRPSATVGTRRRG